VVAGAHIAGGLTDGTWLSLAQIQACASSPVNDTSDEPFKREDPVRADKVILSNRAFDFRVGNTL